MRRPASRNSHVAGIGQIEIMPRGALYLQVWVRRPAVPQSVPTQRSLTDDLATSVLCAHAVVADVPTVRQTSWTINFSTEFASASEHCIALCRLLI